MNDFENVYIKGKSLEQLSPRVPQLHEIACPVGQMALGLRR